MGDPGRAFDAKIDVTAMIPALRAHAISLTRHRAEADDLVHGTLQNAVTQRQQFPSGIDPRVWLFINMRNSFYADGKMPKWDRAPLVVPSFAELDATLGWTGRAKALLVAILRLSVPFRETLMLVVVLGESYEACALVTNCDPRTVKSRVDWGVSQIIAELGAMRM